MLVLKRKKAEKIIIITPRGDRVEIVAVGSTYIWQKMGIIAEPDYQIWREEILPSHLKEDK